MPKEHSRRFHSPSVLTGGRIRPVASIVLGSLLLTAAALQILVSGPDNNNNDGNHYAFAHYDPPGEQMSVRVLLISAKTFTDQDDGLDADAEYIITYVVRHDSHDANTGTQTFHINYDDTDTYEFSKFFGGLDIYPRYNFAHDECTPMSPINVEFKLAESDWDTHLSALALGEAALGLLLVPVIGWVDGAVLATVGLGLELMQVANPDDDLGYGGKLITAEGEHLIDITSGANRTAQVKVKVLKFPGPNPFAPPGACAGTTTSNQTSFVQPWSAEETALALAGSARSQLELAPRSSFEQGAAVDAQQGIEAARSASVQASLNRMEDVVLQLGEGASDGGNNMLLSNMLNETDSLLAKGDAGSAIEMYEIAVLESIASSVATAANEPGSYRPPYAQVGVSAADPPSSTMSPRVINLQLENKEQGALDRVVVRSAAGDIIYVSAPGWDRERLAPDTVLLSAPGEGLLPGATLPVIVVTEDAEKDLLFRFGDGSGISTLPIALDTSTYGDVYQKALEIYDRYPRSLPREGEFAELGGIEEVILPPFLEWGRYAEGAIDLVDLQEGSYLEIVIDAKAPFQEPGQVVVIDEGTDQELEFAVDGAGNLAARWDLAAVAESPGGDAASLEFRIKVDKEAPAGSYDIAFFLRSPEGIVSDTDLAAVDVRGEPSSDGEPPPSSEQGPFSADPAELSFSHKVRATDCPQFVGYVFLTAEDGADVNGEWVVVEQPEWLNIEVEGGTATFEFNCNIDDVTTRTIPGEAVFAFLYEDESGGDGEESREVQVSITADIIGLGGVEGEEEEEDYEVFFIDCAGGATAGGSSLLSDADRKKYSKIEGNLTAVSQPTGNTCSPTSGAIDLLHWNLTIAPGIVNSTVSQLIADLAGRMKTAGTGTSTDQIALGMAGYLEDHAKGKFGVKFVFKSTKTKIVTKTVGTASVPFVPQDSITILDLASEMDNKSNIIVNVNVVGSGGHSVKLVALNTTAADGRYNVAFLNPADGKILQGTMDFDGNIEAGSDDWRIRSYVAITPK